MAEAWSVALFIGIAFLAAGFVKGVVGMGLPTVAIGLLGLVMAPAAAVALLVVPSLVTNLWQLAAGPRFTPLLRRFAPMLLATCVGTALGIRVLTGASSTAASGALGAILIAYGLLGLSARQFTVPSRAERWLGPLVGGITGVIAGATGLFVIPAVPYLGSLGLAKEELIQTLGLFFTVSTIALAAALALSGHFQLSAAGSSLLAVLPALVGMFVGQHVRSKLKPAAFRRWFFIGMVVLGAYSLARAVLSA